MLPYFYVAILAASLTLGPKRETPFKTRSSQEMCIPQTHLVANPLEVLVS